MPTTECGDPPNTESYKVVYSYSAGVNEYWFNTTVTYKSCKANHYLLYPEDIDSGRNVLTCQRNGTWKPETAPNCGLCEFLSTVQ